MMKYHGEPVYRIRVDDVEGVEVSEEENRWIYHKEEDGMIVFWNYMTDFEIYIDPHVFEYCFELIDENSDEEDIV